MGGTTTMPTIWDELEECDYAPDPEKLHDLQTHCLEHGTAEEIFRFAAKVKGAGIGILANRLIELTAENHKIDYLLWFAQTVDGANVKQLSEAYMNHPLDIFDGYGKTLAEFLLYREVDRNAIESKRAEHHRARLTSKTIQYWIGNRKYRFQFDASLATPPTENTLSAYKDDKHLFSVAQSKVETFENLLPHGQVYIEARKWCLTQFTKTTQTINGKRQTVYIFNDFQAAADAFQNFQKLHGENQLGWNKRNGVFITQSKLKTTSHIFVNTSTVL